jgi:hypothetical protein
MASLRKPVDLMYQETLCPRGNNADICKNSFIGYSLDYHNKYEVQYRRYNNEQFMG